MIAWLLLASLLVAPGDDPVVARIGGHDLHASQFGDWMVQRHGHAHIDTWVLEQLILTEAERRGLAPDEETLDRALAAEVQELADRYYLGDIEAWRRSISRTGADVDAFLERREFELEVELCLDALALSEREITDEQLHKRYDSLYGSMQESASLEVLFFDLYANMDPNAEERPEMVELDREARERAEAARQALSDGVDFATVQHDSDPITSSEFVVDGRISSWRKNLLGPEMEQAVSSLDDPGDLSPLVKVWNGYFLARLVSRRALSFDTMRDELWQELMAEPPSAEEHNRVRSWLRETYAPEILLR